MKTFKNPSVLSIAKCASCATGQPLLIPGVFFMQNQNEVWKDVIGYEGFYQVSNLGRVKSLKRIVERIDGKKNYINERILRQKNAGFGYKVVALCREGKNVYCLIHRLVAFAFIHNHDNKPDVNHIDGNKTNNCAINLEWNTKKENSKHAYLNGLNIPPKPFLGADNPKSKTVLQYSMKGVLINVFNSTGDASRGSGVYNSGISRACSGKLKQAGGYIWKYKE